jgi:hypothetical protein
MSPDTITPQPSHLEPPSGDAASNLHNYRVRVGLAECTVLCHTQREAVQLARVKIGQQFPQVRSLMLDILDREFRVDLVGAKTADEDSPATSS